MKNILYFIQLPPPLHGASKANELVYNSKKINRGLQKRLITINYSADLASINTIKFSKIITYFTLLSKFCKELLFHRPNLVYYSIPPTGIGLYKDLPFVLIMKVLFVKPIYHLHGKGIYENIKSSRLKQIVHRWVYSNANVIHLSEKLMEREIKYLNLKNSSLFVIQNGIEPIGIDLHCVPKNDTEAIDILFLSNLLISKGILMAIEIVSKLLKDNYNVKLNIIGDFKDEATNSMVHEHILKHKMTQNVYFFGAKYGTEKYKIMAKMDYLLYPSYNDASPLVILESLQSGLPIVASDQGAIPEIVDNQVGLIFETGNTEDAIAKNKTMIEKLKSDKELFRNNCFSRYNDQYSVEIFENKVKYAFEKCFLIN